VSDDERKYKKAVMKLGRAIRRKARRDNHKESKTFTIELNPEKCLKYDLRCFFESNDSVYRGNIPNQFFRRDSYLIVYGVNHVKTGFARYTSVTLYNPEGLIAVASFTSENYMDDSAKRFLPDHEHVDKLFAVTLRRDCGKRGVRDEFCVEVNTDDLSARALVLFASRAYMHPNGTNSADPVNLLPMNVMYGGQHLGGI